MSLPAAAHDSDLQALLRRSDVTEIRLIELICVGNQVVLRGIVGSFYYKQLAQELVRSRAQGLEIENQICVEYAEVSGRVPNGGNDF